MYPCCILGAQALAGCAPLGSGPGEFPQPVHHPGGGRQGPGAGLPLAGDPSQVAPPSTMVQGVPRGAPLLPATPCTTSTSMEEDTPTFVDFMEDDLFMFSSCYLKYIDMFLMTVECPIHDSAGVLVDRSTIVVG